MDLEKYLEQYSKYQDRIDFISKNYSNFDESIRRINQIQKLENLTSSAHLSDIQERIDRINNFIRTYDSADVISKLYSQQGMLDKVALTDCYIEKIQNIQSSIEKFNLQNYSNILFDIKIREILKSYNYLEKLNFEISDDSLSASIESENTRAKLNELLNLKKLITIENVLTLITFLLPIHTMLLICYPNLRGESEHIHNLISELLAVVLLWTSDKSCKD